MSDETGDDFWDEVDSGPQWFYKTRGERRRGPMSLATLVHLHKRGRFAGTALVWGEGMPEWATYASVFQREVPTAGTVRSTVPARTPPAKSGKAPRPAKPQVARPGSPTPNVAKARKPDIGAPDIDRAAAAAAEKARESGRNFVIALRRGLARWLDMSVFAVALAVLLHVLSRDGHVLAVDALQRAEDQVALVFTVMVLAWIPIEAVLLAIFGSTPGKWACSLSLRGEAGIGERLPQMWHRSWRVALQGMVLGIPAVSIIGQVVGMVSFLSRGHSAWDRKAQTRLEVGPFQMQRIGWLLGMVIAAATISGVVFGLHDP